MNKFYIPSKGSSDWQQLLAQPQKHWRTGYSAKSLAYCWEESGGFPESVLEVFNKSEYSMFHDLEFILGIPEYEVPLPGGDTASQNDVFVLARTKDQLVTIAVEGKVSEPFGPLVEEKCQNMSAGAQERLEYLVNLLGLEGKDINKIRYQLLHRTASALIEAERFHAKTALMLVHTFSQTNEHFDDYSAFVNLFEKTCEINSITHAGTYGSCYLYLAWVTGNKIYLEK